MADSVQLTSRMSVNELGTVAPVKELSSIAETFRDEPSVCQYYFDLADDPTHFSLIQTRFRDPLTQNIFIQDALVVFSEHKNSAVLTNQLEKFIGILDNASCLAMVHKLFIIQNNNNAATVLFLAGSVLKKLLAENFFQSMPLKELVYFITTLPATNNQTFCAYKKNILYCFYVRVSDSANQYWFVELIDAWQVATNNRDKIQLRYIENILMKIYPHTLQGQAAQKWDEYIEQLSQQINQLRKDVVEKKFSDRGDAYLIMRQLQRLVEMVDRHPQHSEFQKRHDTLTVLLSKIIQVNVAQASHQLFNAQNEMSRVFWINPGEIFLDHAIHTPEKQLSGFHQLLWQWHNGEDFTHRVVAPEKIAENIKQLKFKFVLPDQSFFYFHPAFADDCYLLDHYDAHGVFQGEVFRLTEDAPESIIQQAKVMLSKIEYEGLHLPSSLIDFFIEYLVLEDSFLYVHQQVCFFFKSSASMVHKDFVGVESRSSDIDVVQKRPTHFVIRWNGEGRTAAKLSIGDDSVTDMPFLEVLVRQAEVGVLSHAIHPLEKFNGLIEITFINIPIDFSFENLRDLNAQSNRKMMGKADDYSARLFDDWATCVFLKMENKLLLDRLDIQVILVQLERQLQARGYTEKKIKLTLRPMMKKWLKQLYRNPAQTTELARNIHQDIKKFFSPDFVSANKSVVKKNDFRTYYLMSPVEKEACLRNLASKHADARKRVADWALRNNEVKVHFFGSKFLDYLASVRNYVISRADVFAKVIVKQAGRKHINNLPIDLAVQQTTIRAQEAKKTKDKKSKAAFHALLTLTRQEEVVFTAAELYQLMTMASQEGVLSALKEGRNQKILVDAPVVLVNLYCYIKLAYPLDTQVMNVLNHFLFSDPEFLLDFKESHPKQYAQLMALKQCADHTEVLQILCGQGKKLLAHHMVFSLFLIYAGKSHLDVLAQQVDPIKLTDCYLLLAQTADHRKTLHKNFLRLMSQTICLALLKYPDGFFVHQLLVAKKIQYVLPGVLTYLDQQYTELEKTNLVTIVRAAGQHPHLSFLFGENAAAFIIFLKYALPEQIAAVVAEVENLVINNLSFMQKLVENSAEVLGAILPRLDESVFAPITAMAQLLREKIQSIVKTQAVFTADDLSPHHLVIAATYFPLAPITLFHLGYEDQRQLSQPEQPEMNNNRPLTPK